MGVLAHGVDMVECRRIEEALERRDRRVYPQSRFRTQLSGKQPFPRGR